LGEVVKWQDAAFTGGGLALIVGLVPMFSAVAAPPVATSLTMAAVLSMFGAAQISLKVPGGAAMSFIQAAMWSVLLVRGL